MMNGKQPSTDLKMLIKLMGMTGSNSDNEALNAVRLANKWLDDKGHNWHDLLTGLVTVEADPFATAPTVTVNVGSAPRYAAAAPPPPPKQFNDVKEIEGYFTKMELKMGLPNSIQTRINNIEKEWKRNGFLLWGDYDYLRKQAKSRVKY
jgi:hypothetical protein